jgi:hypothetical protein
MDSLESNKTWHLVDLPPGCKPIGCKWILKKKLKPDGTVDKYKARLVAKGFRQRENIDFFDTFSLHFEITLLFSFSLFFLLNYSVVSIIERLLPYRVDIRISIIWCNSGRSLQCSSASYFI